VDRSVERQLPEEHDLGNMPALDGTGRARCRAIGDEGRAGL
jgi:hypothetical protein